eukprot:109877-Karenia_brevis.AAC.1
MEREVSTCVSVYRTPDRGQYGRQEKSKEFDLQEKHWTGERCSGKEKETKELNDNGRKFKAASLEGAASIKAIRGESPSSLRGKKLRRKTMIRTTIVDIEAANDTK